MIALGRWSLPRGRCRSRQAVFLATAASVALSLSTSTASAQGEQIPEPRPEGSPLNSPPPNDGFSTPMVLAPEGITDLFNNTGATKEPNEPAHAGKRGGGSLWYRWTPRTDRLVTIDACLSPLDTLVGVYRGNSLPALKEVASDDDSCPPRGEIEPPVDLPPGIPPPPAGPETDFGSIVQFTARAGTTYRIAVDGKRGQQGQILLALDSVELKPPPPASPPPLSAAPPPRRDIKKIRLRRHPPRLKLVPRCEAGHYSGKIALKRVLKDGSTGERRFWNGRYLCRRGKARFPDRGYLGSGFVRLYRGWWKQAKAGITLVAEIELRGDEAATKTPFTLQRKRRKNGHRRSASASYYVSNIETVSRKCWSAQSHWEALEANPYGFNGGIAYQGEWLTVAASVLPYWPGRGYGQLTWSYSNIAYNVPFFTATSNGVTYGTVGGRPLGGQHAQWPPSGSNVLPVGAGVYTAMAVYVYTPRIGSWRFFDYVAPDAHTSYGVRVDGPWCWHPYPY